ncbi:MAG: hypothetical protein VX737_02380 [Pseudomonadota bacterium]|nr:hypothetical protein [Pseudomonadota bacterium]
MYALTSRPNTAALIREKVIKIQEQEEQLNSVIIEFDAIAPLLTQDIQTSEVRTITNRILAAFNKRAEIHRKVSIWVTSDYSWRHIQGGRTRTLSFNQALVSNKKIMDDLYKALSDKLKSASRKTFGHNDRNKLQTVDDILMTVDQYQLAMQAIEEIAGPAPKTVQKSHRDECLNLIQNIAKDNNILDAILDKIDKVISLTVQKALQEEEESTLRHEEREAISDEIRAKWQNYNGYLEEEFRNELITKLERGDNRTFVDLLMTTSTSELDRLINTTTQKPIQDFLKQQVIPELKSFRPETWEQLVNLRLSDHASSLLKTILKVLNEELVKVVTLLASSCEGPKISWKKSLEAIAKSLQPELQKATNWNQKFKAWVQHYEDLEKRHPDSSKYDSKLMCRAYSEVDNPDTFKTPVEALQASLETFTRLIESCEIPSEVMKNFLNRLEAVNENNFNNNPYIRIAEQSLIKLLQTLSKKGSSEIQTMAQSLIKELNKIKNKENPLVATILTVLTHTEKSFQQTIANPKLYSLLETISTTLIHATAFTINIIPITSELNIWTMKNIPAFEAEKSASANDPKRKTYELINRWNDKLGLWTPEQEKQRKTEVENLKAELINSLNFTELKLLEEWSKLYEEDTNERIARYYREALTRITQYAKKQGLSSHKLITDCLLAVTTTITALTTLILSQKDLLDNFSLAIKSEGENALDEFLFMPSTIIKFFECLSDGILSQQQLRETSKKSRESIHRALRALSSSIRASIDIVLTKVIAENNSLKEGTKSNLINFIAYISPYIREITFTYLTNTRIQRWFLALLRTFILTPFLLGYSAYRGNLLKETPSIIKGWGKSLLYVISRGILHAPSILLFWIKFAWNAAKMMLISTYYLPKIIVSQFGWKKPLLITTIATLITAAVSTAVFFYFNVLCMILKAVSIALCSGLLSYHITNNVFKQKSTAKAVIGGLGLITGFYCKFLLTLSLSVSLSALPLMKNMRNIFRWNNMTKITFIASGAAVGLYFLIHPALIGSFIMLSMLILTQKDLQKEKGKVSVNKKLNPVSSSSMYSSKSEAPRDFTSGQRSMLRRVTMALGMF